jgi:hypothetical protein
MHVCLCASVRVRARASLCLCLCVCACVLVCARVRGCAHLRACACATGARSFASARVPACARLRGRTANRRVRPTTHNHAAAPCSGAMQRRGCERALLSDLMSAWQSSRSLYTSQSHPSSAHTCCNRAATQTRAAALVAARRQRRCLAVRCAALVVAARIERSPRGTQSRRRCGMG